MDRFDEMRTKGVNTNDATATSFDILKGKTAYAQGRKITGSLVPSGGGGSGYNVYSQSSEPSNRNGIWIKNDGGSSNAKFISYGTKKGNTINPASFDYLKTNSTIVGQVIVNGKLYSFGTSSSTSFVYDFKTKQHSELNVPTISVQVSFGAVHHNGKIYVFYVSGNQNCYYEFDIGSNTSTATKQLYKSQIVYSSSMSMACEPYFYDGKIYMFTGYGTTSKQTNHKYTFDIETKTMTETSIGQFIATYQYEQGFISGEGQYVYIISRSGTTSCDLRRIDVVTNQISVLKTFYPADFETETYVPSENCLYINNGYVYIFFSMSNTSSKKYVRYNMTTKESELLEVDYSYFVNMYDNNSSGWVNTNQRIMLDETSGILYMRDKGVTIYGYQFENSPAIEILEDGTIVVIQGLDYSHATQIIDSSGLIVDVSNVYVVEDGELNGDLIVHVGDGEKWNFLKGFVRVTLDTGEEVSYISATYGQPIAEPPAPSKDGYEFVYWTLNGSEYDFSTPVTEPITLEAKWIENNPTFIDYIESSGTQYIDTGFKPNNNTSIEMKVLIPNSRTGQQTRFFEVRNNANEVKEAFGILSFDDSNKLLQFRYNTSTNGSLNNAQLATDTEYVIRTDKNKMYVNDVLKIEQTTSTFQVNYNLLLFGFVSPSLIGSDIGIYRLYYFKIYDNGTLVHDFKPCKNTRGVYCMYDSVTNRYYYNQGTGEFRGNDWQPSYIESSGTQYIDTGINLTSTHNIVFDGYANEGGGPICGVIATNGDYRLHHLGDNKYRYIRRKSDGLSDGYVFTSTTYAFNIRHVLRTDANKLYVDETLAGTVTSYELNCDIPLYVFGVNKYNTAVPESSIRMYSFKIYDGDTLVRDYIPAFDDNRVACLYDKVSETYFYNAGTGTFTAG
jgi:hypothetical protein